jgi:hypothetical protein
MRERREKDKNDVGWFFGARSASVLFNFSESEAHWFFSILDIDW